MSSPAKGSGKHGDTEEKETQRETFFRCIQNSNDGIHIVIDTEKLEVVHAAQKLDLSRDTAFISVNKYRGGNRENFRQHDEKINT